MPSFRKPRIKPLVAALLVLSFLLITSCDRADEVGLNPGDRAPAFEMRDLAGRSVTLDQFNGKVIILNFWATWCAPCIAEMPALEKLYLKFRDQGLVVLSVAVDDTSEAVNVFREQLKLTFPIVIDVKREGAAKYKVIGFPETFVLDRAGKIILFTDPDTGMPVTKIVGPKRWDSPSMIKALQVYF